MGALGGIGFAIVWIVIYALLLLVAYQVLAGNHRRHR